MVVNYKVIKKSLSTSWLQYKKYAKKKAITEYIRNVDPAILNMVFENTIRRVNNFF
jgi:hypothetical protein